MKVTRGRAPRDYRSVGVMLDTARTPGRQEKTLTISLWWWDAEVTW